MEDVVLIQVMLSHYHLDTGCYPTTAQGLVALVEKPIIAPLPVGWKKQAKEVPSLDPWGRAYLYKGIIAPGKQCAQAYELYSLGEDLTDPTDDVLVTGP